MMNDLKEEIRSKKFSLETGRVAQSKLYDVKQSLAASEKQLAAMQESVPDFSKDKDMLVKVSEEIGEKIAERMPTRSQMQKGLDDPQRLVQTDVTHCIDTTPQVRRMAEINGFKTEKGKLKGGDAIKLWQLCRSAVGEDANSEWLRKD